MRKKASLIYKILSSIVINRSIIMDNKRHVNLQLYDNDHIIWNNNK